MNTRHRSHAAMQMDQDLPPATLTVDGKEVDVKLECWWLNIIKTGKYHKLCKFMAAILSITLTPNVEQSFSVMNNLITAKMNRLYTSTYSAYQDVKYDLN